MRNAEQLEFPSNPEPREDSHSTYLENAIWQLKVNRYTVVIVYQLLEINKNTVIRKLLEW